MASNLTGQVRNIAEVATSRGERRLSRKITVDVRGEILQLKVVVENSATWWLSSTRFLLTTTSDTLHGAW